MDEVRYDFRVLTRLEAEALGRPGQRTFRLIVGNDRGETAVLWIEKEQLQALGEAIDRLLAQLGPRRPRRWSTLPPPSSRSAGSGWATTRRRAAACWSPTTSRATRRGRRRCA